MIYQKLTLPLTLSDFQGHISFTISSLPITLPKLLFLGVFVTSLTVASKLLTHFTTCDRRCRRHRQEYGRLSLSIRSYSLELTLYNLQVTLSG